MNISVSEIIVVVLIALIVIKPEQMPDVAFAFGRFLKTVRRMVNKVKDEVKDWVEPIEKVDEHNKK